MSEQIGRVAFIGLGVMGYPMAGHLAKRASSVTVFNRNTAKATQWLKEHQDNAAQCAIALTPMDAAAAADVVFVCVGNDDDVESRRGRRVSRRRAVQRSSSHDRVQGTLQLMVLLVVQADDTCGARSVVLGKVARAAHRTRLEVEAPPF